MSGKKCNYTGVELDNESKTKLMHLLKGLIPQGWIVYCHHMTIRLGELSSFEKTEFILGEKKELKINSIGIGKKVIAVGVDGCKSFNKIPHITVAVDRANGGKPYMSNEITKWYPVQRDEVVLTGTIKEM